jgi:hypothetical protein
MKLQLPEQPGQGRQYEAHDQARHEGEVETEIASRVMDVAGQAANPAASNARPKRQSDDAQDQAKEEYSLAQVIHS